MLPFMMFKIKINVHRNVHICKCKKSKKNQYAFLHPQSVYFLIFQSLPIFFTFSLSGVILFQHFLSHTLQTELIRSVSYNAAARRARRNATLLPTTGGNADTTLRLDRDELVSKQHAAAAAAAIASAVT